MICGVRELARFGGRGLPGGTRAFTAVSAATIPSSGLTASFHEMRAGRTITIRVSVVHASCEASGSAVGFVSVSVERYSTLVLKPL